MLEITTSQLKARKKVEIDGHPYVVRKLGAGEQLALNQLLRKAKALGQKLSDGENAEQDEIEAENLSEKMVSILVGLFDDGGDGSKSRALVSSLNETEMAELFAQIFPEDNNETPAVS